MAGTGCDASLPLSLLFAALLCWAPVAARASCFSEVLGGDGPFAGQIERDPKGAIALLETQLSRTFQGRSARMSTAHLYAILMDAYQGAGNIDAARAAAAQGMEALTPADGDGLRRRLQLTSIKLLMDQGQLERAAAEYEQASAHVPGNAPDLVCVLGDRGYLRMLVGRKVDAAVDAMRAYQLAGQIGKDEIQLLAGQLLARLYSQVGLYDEALALSDAPIAFYSHSWNRLALSDAYLFRGDVYALKHDYAAANADFLNSRVLLQAAGDLFVLSYTQQRLCSVAAKMPDRPDASAMCHAAYEAAKAVKNPITAKFTLAALGVIEFDERHPRAAVDLWDRVLADDGVDIPKRLRSEVYQLTGRARAQLGDMVGALHDTNLYLAALEEEQKTRSADQVALLNVEFQTTLKDEELARVHAEARTREVAAERHASIRNLIAVSATLLVATLSFGTWLWHRKLAIKARAATEERLAAIGRLTGGIAHDFNNLVTVLQQALGLLGGRDSVADDAVALDLVQQARRASQICADITSQLLSFSRQQNLQPQAIDVDRYLHDVLPLLERAAGNAVKVRLELQQPCPVAWADQRQLTAALLNLVSNARDAMSSGGTLTIQAATDVEQRIRLDVIDEGCGMTPAVLTRAVEPFYSTKAVGSGSGLGLSMVQGFASQSGGALAIRSEPNRGTTVSLWLPAAGAFT
jgi:signal transduction histidine kinase